MRSLPLLTTPSAAALADALSSYSKDLAQLLKDDDPDTDQLELSDLEDDPIGLAAPRAPTSFPLFASDDTLGNLDEQVSGTSAVRRIKRASPSSSPAAPTRP